ncbi:MAG TPA: hypothetical protein DCQ06_12545 [Myxococcales bacterium]|nr:hypothetical protein [Myxococcales bacterium]HAN32416.1 hypothetical protein [Myxococcales bacterium]
MSERRIALSLSIAISLIALMPGCQRGEKSCRYYSLVLEKSEDPSERMDAIRQIRGLSSKDQLKCDDDKVFTRFAAVVDDKDGNLGKYRVPLLEAVESVGQASPKLNKRVQGLFVKGLGHLDSAPIVANIISSWRRDAHERGKTWAPEPAVVKAIAAVIRRVKDATAKATLLEALWLSLPDEKDKREYVDLLLELASAKPSAPGNSIGITIKALKFLTKLRVKTDAAFEVYLNCVFAKDAARAEAYGQARLALAVIDPVKVAGRVLGIYTKRDASFDKWAKDQGLFDWEWNEGPKLTQLLSDLHDARTAQALVERVSKPIDASDTGKPKIWDTVKRGFPWASYITSRLQLSMWGLASMGEGLAKVAPQIGQLAATQGPTVEQRTMPFIALSVSGASNAWASMLQAYQAINPAERGDFITPMSYAVEPENLADWEKVIVTDKSEGTQLAIKDPTIVGRLGVAMQCKQGWDAAPDAKSKLVSLGACYAGFLKTGDNIQKEKAAIGLVHLAAKGVDVVVPLLAAFEKSSSSDTTLRQVIFVGLKIGARSVEHMKAIYKTQQLEVQKPNNNTWDWEFDILLNHMLSRLEKAAKAIDAEKKGGAAPAAPAAPAAKTK